MASRERKGSGDFVLESRHLVGLFFLLVVIFGIVFTLGYLLGRSQYDTTFRGSPQKEAAAQPPKTAEIPTTKPNPEKTDSSSAAPPAQNKSDWDFYHAAEPKAGEDHLQPPAKIAAPAPAPKSSRAAVKPPKSVSEPASGSSVGGQLIPRGSIMLQVAAVKSQSDALALAQALQQKKLPAFVIPPGADSYYRVQVGPYADAKSAAAGQHNLEANGFKSIVKR
jgi:septal ring-binding cell division protein DamX